MNKLASSNKVYVKKSKIKNAGRGVFANCDIKNGEIIERCPIIKLSKYETTTLGETTLVTYLFFHGKNKEQCVVALGFGSLYNHSYKPNITYKLWSKEELIDFIAICDIKKEDELTFNYYHDSFSKGKKDPLWFEDEHRK